MPGTRQSRTIAKIALVDRTARKLVRQLQGRGGAGRARPEAQERGCGEAGREAVAAAILSGDAAATAETLRRHVLIQGDGFSEPVANLRALDTTAA